jgi:hypothetical protein
MHMAEGSLEESRYFILAQDLGYAQTKELIDTLKEVSRLLTRDASAILTSFS